MFFEFCSCPKCGSKFYPDYDLTVKKYSDEIFSEYLVTGTEEAPQVPGYLVFLCQSNKCQFSEKLSDQDILLLIRKEWAKLAWKETQRAANNTFEFEGHVTRYLIDNDLGKSLTKRDLERNPLIKDFLKIKSEQQKHIKTSNDT